MNSMGISLKIAPQSICLYTLTSSGKRLYLGLYKNTNLGRITLLSLSGVKLDPRNIPSEAMRMKTGLKRVCGALLVVVSNFILDRNIGLYIAANNDLPGSDLCPR
jgi:hypothetical protein